MEDFDQDISKQALFALGCFFAVVSGILGVVTAVLYIFFFIL